MGGPGEYYPRALELFEDLTTGLARAFLQRFPTPEALTPLTAAQWRGWTQERGLGVARTAALWALVQQPQLPIPPGVVRSKARLVSALVRQLAVTHAAVEDYREEIDRFFGTLPLHGDLGRLLHRGGDEAPALDLARRRRDPDQRLRRSIVRALNDLPGGAPTDFYTRLGAERAVAAAEAAPGVRRRGLSARAGTGGRGTPPRCGRCAALRFARAG
ncbi:MAG TPA: hypothetical protein VMT79_03120, partial [Candidatus Binatia bacterium]|nr:hypothetical protein [Candidatus Binatia bacterium]